VPLVEADRLGDELAERPALGRQRLRTGLGSARRLFRAPPPGQPIAFTSAMKGRAISPSSTPLLELSEPPVSCAPDTPDDEVAALFDKYNLVTLAVVDEHERLAGIITADDVITMLRHDR